MSSATAEPEAMPIERGLPNPAEQYLPQLDGIRGLAIALVLMVHCYGRGPDPRLYEVSGGGFIEQVMLLGWAGVELFFVLSGLLVTSMLLRRKRQGQPLGPFFARRAARIVPAYLAVISAIAALSLFRLGALVDPITVQASALWPYYALFLNNYFGWLGVAADEAEKVLGPMWSVATEMQYYLVWPLVVMALSEARLKLVLPLALAVSVAFRLASIDAHVPAHPVYVASFTHLDGIIAGSFLALHWDRMKAFAERLAAPGLAFSIAALTTFFWLAGTTEQFDPRVQSLGYSLVALASSLLVILAVSDARVARLFSLAPLRLLGRYSYFIYLVHLPILLLLDQLAVRPGLWSWLAYYLLVTCGLVALGALSWRYFEHPIIRWNQRREKAMAPPEAARGGR